MVSFCSVPSGTFSQIFQVVQKTRLPFLDVFDLLDQTVHHSAVGLGQDARSRLMKEDLRRFDIVQ
jgi:hypothetical protein